MNPDVAILSYDYPPLDGGISRLSVEIVKVLRDAGKHVHVVAPRFPGRDGAPTDPSPDTRRVPVDRGLRELATFAALRAVPRDVPVLTTVWQPEATLALLARRRRLFVLAHGNEVMPTSSRLRRAIRRKVLERAKCVICNSRFTEELVRAAAPDAHTRIIHPIVDLDRFRPPSSLQRTQAREKWDVADRDFVLLTVARLDTHKGHDLTLDALAEMPPASREKITWLVAGVGPEETSLCARAAALGLDGMVRFLGFVADDDLPSLYHSADAVVLGSRVDPVRHGMEGFGIVLVEAQASGVPVIAMRSGGMTDAVREGEGSWLLPPGLVDPLAALISKLAEDPHSLREHGARAREQVSSRFSAEIFGKELMSVLEIEGEDA